MKEILFYPCLWGILTLSTLSSCRTEDVANTQKQVEDKRFAVFIPKSEGEKIDYVQGFAYLYQNYFKENSIKEKDQKLVAKDFGVVDFRIHSQLFIQEDGTKGMVFPLRKENSINGLIMAILENNDTSLRYTVLDESQKGYTETMQKFLAVDRENDRPIHIPSSGKFPPGSSPVALAPPIKTHGISINDNGNGDIDREGDGGSSGPVKEIREVTITVPKVPSPPVVPPPLPQDIKLPPVGPGGGCEMYENCPPYRGGGGGSPTPNQNLKDPCSNIKIQQSTQEYKNIVDALEKKLKETHENGYIQYKDGNYSELTQRGESENSKSMKLPDDISNLKGFIHTHVKKTSVTIDGEVYEAEGIDMFSPADVQRFLEIVKFSSDQGRPLEEAYGIMISSSGNYSLRFTGDKNQIITKFQGNSLNINVYLRYMQQTSGEFKDMSIEQKFLKYLDEYMNAKGVSLYKDNKDGTNTRMDLNESDKKQMTKNNC
ncbi:TPA: hypothetical protein ACGZ99_002303 [Elizabethkingia anophelis]